MFDVLDDSRKLIRKCWIYFLGLKMMMHLQDVKPQAYRNAYDIPRRNLLDQLTRMRSNLLRTSQKLIRGQDEGKSCS